ncbi:lipopolysaccharide biosynthesis protein [Aminobacterium sp. UBA5514]|uniref:lipopolysaccharide biosynthesis protein n=1 Tax=Aminobacterium sp. UBA5514 TaxID=1946036 RepID=UPI00257E97A3|nr:oligosaccharide flippase family protein [Aminobacterium sp. UBA5514]
MYFLEKITGKIFKESFIRKVAIVAGGTALGHIIGVLASPVLTRLFSPEEFGIFSAFTSFGGMLASFVCLAYERAIPIPAEEEDSLALSAVAILSSTLIGISLFGILLMLNLMKLNIKVIRELGFYIYLLPLFVTSLGIYQVFTYLAIRFDCFNDLAKTRIWQKTVGTAMQIIGGMSGMGTLALILGGIIGQGGGSWYLKKKVVGNDLKKIRGISCKKAFFVLKRYKNFPFLAAPAALMNVAANDLVPIFLLSSYGGEVAGFFALGQRVIQVPLSFISQAVSQVYVGEVTKLKYSDPQALLLLLHNTTRQLAVIGFFPCAVLFFWGADIFAFIFGSQWYEAGTYVQVLAALEYIRFIVTPLSQLNALEKQRIVFGWNLLRLLGVFSAFYISSLLKVAPTVSLRYYVVAMAFLFALNYFLFYREVVRLIKNSSF